MALRRQNGDRVIPAQDKLSLLLHFRQIASEFHSVNDMARNKEFDGEQPLGHAGRQAESL